MAAMLREGGRPLPPASRQHRCQRVEAMTNIADGAGGRGAGASGVEQYGLGKPAVRRRVMEGHAHAIRANGRESHQCGDRTFHLDSLCPERAGEADGDLTAAMHAGDREAETGDGSSHREGLDAG
jgi:hypothetical protein